MYQKTTKILIILAVLVFSTLQAQLKSQIITQPSVEQRIQIPGLTQNNMSLNLFDPDRFSMHHSYSMSMSTFGNNAFSTGMYLNNMSYIFSEKLIMNARIGFMHDPLKLGNSSSSLQMSNPMQNLIYGADITYRPKDNLLFRFSFDKRPAYYSNYGYYNRGYISPYGYQYLLGY